MIAFVAGLHRSGTSLLARSIADHPDASGFSDTGFPEDEGQFLQSVYLPAYNYGGPGRFGFDARSHLTERSPLVTEENRLKLLAEWGRHWDTEKSLLVEKSPPNLLKLRFLQALFPEAAFVTIIRHPVPVSLATAKWLRNGSIDELIQHWLVCHERFAIDAGHMRRLIAIRYEDLVTEPALVGCIQEALGLVPTGDSPPVQPGVNEYYFEQWRSQREVVGCEARFEQRVRRFGYSLDEPERRDLDPAADIAKLIGAWRDSAA